MTIDSVQIECFLKAARLLNFSKAAENLFISQPVLSRKISRLEEELGTELFDRSGRNISLTKSGEMLFQYFSECSTGFNDIMEKIDSEKNVSNRQIKIGVCEGLDLSAYMKAIVSGYKRVSPETEIMFTSGPVEALIESFRHGMFDIIIMLEVTIVNYVKNGVVSKVKNTPFITANKCVIYSADNPVGAIENPKLEDFKNQTLLCLKKDHIPNKVLTQSELFEAHGFSPKVRFLPNVDSIYMALQIGDVFCVSDNHERYLNSGNMLHFDLKETQFISLVSHEMCTKSVLEFIDFCLGLDFDTIYRTKEKQTK
ncbi:MAG: LysR family transcriptional regulator [Firmicutes bacterium]|nr:LysR family transcriptional regulator [Bacillota bacterium]